MYIEFRSIADMNKVILHNLQKIPHDINFVVGIPRSGMLPANLIALYLNKPFTDIDSFMNGKIYSSGNRGAFISHSNKNRVLVVDDSICGGNSLSKAKEKLKGMEEKYHLEYVVIYATTEGSKIVDYYFEIIDYPRIFQWNIFHHKSFIPRSCFDIDGVLCQDPPVDDDGPVYNEYIANTSPLYVPSLEIDTLVSCRLEKYREVTEKWLERNKVKYKHLIMLDFKTKEERRAWGKHGEYKGEVYKKSGNILFVESCLDQAKIISKISGKPVFCTETFEMIIDNVVVEKIETRLRWCLVKLLRKIYYAIKSKVILIRS